MDSKKVSDAIQTQVSGYLSDFSGQSAPYREVLTPKHRTKHVLTSVMEKIDNGTADIDDLGAAYKCAPHSPPAALFKYIVHRVNNVDKYNSNDGHKLDHSFMNSIGAGGAGEDNKFVTTRHLNTWLATNPHLVEQALANRESLGQKIRESGVHIKQINGEPYVAMSRGLDTAVMGPEMPLASFSDLHDSGFGAFMHHVWMPVSDLWYAYPYAPQGTWGNDGHENEWVFSNAGTRYAASLSDIRPSLFADRSVNIKLPQGIFKMDPEAPVDTTMTAEDLKTPAADPAQFYLAVTHPSYNEAVGAHLVQVALASKRPEDFLPIVAMAKQPTLALHKALIEALDQGPDDAPFLPAKMVGDCFDANKGITSPQAFNNSQNTERYLRALADYFGRFTDAESASNAYHKLLSAGRMNDTTVTTLADLAKTHKSLPGTTMEETKTLVSEMARWNQHLTQRQLLILSAVPAAAMGLLTRKSPLAPGVQEGIAKNAEGSDLAILANRDDLAVHVADELLKRFRNSGNPTLGVNAIASNPRIPIELLKKHLTAETPSAFAIALHHGIQERGILREDIVKPLPIGGVE